MTREEAIKILDVNNTSAKELERIKNYKGFNGREAIFMALKDACLMAVAALREQEERESVWHDAKDNSPKKPGLYYGKRDDTDSMYLCQYRDGVWTLDAYPETRMHVIKWAYYNAFVQEHEERRWIPVTERLPDLELVDANNDGFDLCSCLVTVKNFRVKNGRYVKKAWYDGDGFMDENCIIITQDVTHWMPLPKPPKEG